jgi:thiamine biosynthesis lipoprotein
VIKGSKGKAAAGLRPCALLVLTAALACGGDREAVREFSGPTMGTSYSVKLVAPPLTPDARARIAAAIRDRLAVVDRLMSTWNPDSELSRFNRHGDLSPFRVSPPTLEVFRIARSVSVLSSGALDVTAGPLIAAWGFGAGASSREPPSAAELARLSPRVGWQRVRIDPASSSLVKTHPETTCDLSAVAKGYAVDLVGRELAALGYADFLVEVGGELKARGHNARGEPWRVAIESPDARGGAGIARTVRLRDQAVATSGDYRDFHERDGVRISHIIDPRSGRPIEHGLASVSVVDDAAARADGLATALMVLGPEKGWELAVREGLAAYFMVRDVDGTLTARATPGFEALDP